MQNVLGWLTYPLLGRFIKKICLLLCLFSSLSFLLLDSLATIHLDALVIKNISTVAEISGSQGGEYKDEVYWRCRRGFWLHRTNDGGSKHLWNVGTILPEYTAQHLGRQSSADFLPSAIHSLATRTSECPVLSDTRTPLTPSVFWAISHTQVH
jgi:hypothetical protein